MKLPRLFAAAFVIGRRDFTATVFSKAFLLFLLGPLFPLLAGALFGGIGAKVADDVSQPVVAAVVSSEDFTRLAQARQQLQDGFPGVSMVRLYRYPVEADELAQRKRLLDSEERPILAVLNGSLASPRVAGDIQPDGPTAGQLRAIIQQARAGDVPGVPLTVTSIAESSGSNASIRALTARAGQAVLFFLTLLLAGMLLSQLVEEKSNKVIEILAAAVPVEAIFLGKLFAMLAMSLTGIFVWAGAIGAAVIAFVPADAIAAVPAPAIGWGAFILLCVIYFSMSYLLLGAAFLGIGSQASTVREVQTLSLPVTMGQVIIFAIASAAVGDPNGAAGIAAAAFPLSSPFAMVARAAESPLLWPHLLALLWQTAWVALIIRFASRLFRRSVLKSGGRRRRWWRRAASQGSAAPV